MTVVDRVDHCMCRADGRSRVVLIHGVGFGPETLAPLAAALAPFADILVATRRGYAARSHEPPPPSVSDHVDDLLGTLDSAGIERAVLVGISGGATVALATALTAPERVATAVVHEPAVGRIAPELRGLIIEALAGGGGALARFLAGERTWAELPLPVRRRIESSTGLIEADAVAFARYEPDLQAESASLVVSLGDRSAPTRRLVAERLAARTGAPVLVIPDCGHLPQLDAPEAFARAILARALIADTKEM